MGQLKPSNIVEFNEKWGAYLEDGFYGLAIPDIDVITYLDEQFHLEITKNMSSFTYSQIKVKFGACRIYATSDKVHVWEEQINKILGSKM